MNQIKRILSAILILALCLAFCPAAAAAGNPFEDVPDHEWYTNAVNYCYTLGLMNGVSETAFQPDADTSRAMLVTVLYRLADSPRAGTYEFDDVDPEHWYADPVYWAAENGYVQGYGDGRFAPNDPITREQIVTILWRFEGSPTPTGSNSAFIDADQISDWAYDAVAWARDSGIINGMPDGSFAPQAHATRSQIATILRNYTPTCLEYPPNRYRPDGFYKQGELLRNDGAEANAVGVDVSDWQGVIDWEKVADYGVDFAIIRVAYRGYTRGSIIDDSYFTENIEGALDAGLDVGVYFFSQAITTEEAIEEADYLLEKIEGYDITYPLVFDWERQSADDSRTKDTPGSVITACADAFCKRIADAGYMPMVYGNPSDVPSNLDLSLLTKYPFWLAHYSTNWVPTSFPYRYSIWQYTSSGSVTGIYTRVDLNVCLVNW